MGRGTDSNPLYGAVLPRGSQQPSVSQDSPSLPQSGQAVQAEEKMVAGTHVVLLYDIPNISKGALGVVESYDSVTGSYWVQFYGHLTSDVVNPSFVGPYNP